MLLFPQKVKGDEDQKLQSPFAYLKSRRFFLTSRDECGSDQFRLGAFVLSGTLALLSYLFGTISTYMFIQHSAASV